MPETGKFEPLVVQIRRFHEMLLARSHLPMHLKLSRRLPLAAPPQALLNFVSSGANVPLEPTSASSLTTTLTGPRASPTHLWQVDASDCFILWPFIVAAAATSSFLFFFWRALRFFDNGTNAPCDDDVAGVCVAVVTG
jgi:hypothetical protein